MTDKLQSENQPISWPGAGSHEGHTVSLAERWPTRIENATVEVSGPAPVVRDGTLTCGRVACSCDDGWAVGGWPVEFYDRIVGEPLSRPGQGVSDA